MKRTAILAILLASPLAFGQKFQDVSAAGCPMSLTVNADFPDMGPYVAAHNHSDKGVLALVAVVRTADVHGRVLPGLSTMDYAFKVGVIASQEDRGVMPVDAADPDSSVKQAEGAVLFVRFEDGSTWGNPEAGKEMIAERPEKLAFLEHMVQVYDTRGEAAFAAALNEPKRGSGAFKLAMCLKGDADYDKVARIDLARKRLAAAQEWQATGIF